MDHRLLARAGLSLLCAIQGIATLALDLNRTHATNPEWVRHARFHVVWQSIAVALASVLELGLLWGGWVGVETGFYLAMLIASLSPVAFLLSFASMRWFAGALSDPNGIPPLRIAIGNIRTTLDMNLVAVLAALATMGILVLIYDH